MQSLRTFTSRAMSSIGERGFVLYDIPSQHPGSSWSPNAWKARYMLNYKGLAHRTVWVEYPEIEPTVKPLGALPTGKRGGKPLYTIPTVQDLSNGKVVSDSFEIAKYLDDAYPNTPPILPQAIRGLTGAVHITLREYYLPEMFRLVIPGLKLNPASMEYYKEVKSKAYGVPYDEISPRDLEAREPIWDGIEKQMDVLDGFYAENNTGSGWITGETPTFIDFVLAGYFTFARILLKDEFDAHVGKWHNGRWAKLVDAFEKHKVVY